MDPLRQLRFVIPALFFYCSLGLGKLLSLNFNSIWTLKEDSVAAFLLDASPQVLVAIAAGLAALAFPLGWLIGAFGLAVLRLWNHRHRPYEAKLADSSWKNLMKRFGMTDVTKEDKAGSKYRLQALATLDHAQLKPEISSWIQRRWNAFHLSLHAGSSLVLGCLSGWLICHVPFRWDFLVITTLSVAVLWYSSYGAWKETMRMFEFQIRSDAPTRNCCERLHSWPGSID
jgi:hypothetical protein